MRRVHPSQKITLLPAGRLRLSMQVGDLTQLSSWVLEGGKSARVIEPEGLRQRVVDELRGALAAYE
jgi:predicted DNA-binding transcriptional regulator YafY